MNKLANNGMHMYMHKCTSGTTNQSSFLCNNKTGSGNSNNVVCRKQDVMFVYLSICSFEFVMPRLGKRCNAMRCNVKLRDAKNQADKRSQKNLHCKVQDEQMLPKNTAIQ